MRTIMPPLLFDEKCADLADYFLADGVKHGPVTREQRADLAATIQGAVEDWFLMEETQDEHDLQKGQSET